MRLSKWIIRFPEPIHYKSFCTLMGGRTFRQNVHSRVGCDKSFPFFLEYDFRFLALYSVDGLCVQEPQGRDRRLESPSYFSMLKCWDSNPESKHVF